MQANLSLLVAAVLLASLSAAFAKPPPPEEDAFVGTTSGYGAIRSITVNSNDQYTIIGHWTDHINCMFKGTGVLEYDVLVVDDMKKFCTDGSVLSVPSRYTFDEMNSVIREEYNFSSTKTSR